MASECAGETVSGTTRDLVELYDDVCAVGHFLERECVHRSDARVSHVDLHKSFCRWFEANGEAIYKFEKENIYKLNRFLYTAEEYHLRTIFKHVKITKNLYIGIRPKSEWA